MSAITQKIHRWFEAQPKSLAPPRADPIGEQVRAAVTAQTRAKVDASRCYEARIQAMVDDLFLKMRKPSPHA